MVKQAIILLGVSCSGKTTYAKQFAQGSDYKYISYDSFYSYRAEETLEANFEKLKSLIGDSEKIIMDGYYNFRDKNFERFKKEICKNVECVVVFASLDTLLRRRKSKGGEILKEDSYGIIHNYLVRYPEVVNYKKAKFVDTSNDSFEEPNIHSLKELNKYLKEINKKSFDKYLLLMDYDKNYQDIEVINFKGYIDSATSWDNMKDLVKWKDKLVMDLGCFHGYFAFKAEREGATVVGLDKHIGVLDTARLINWLGDDSVKFEYWLESDKIKKCDVILCLNVLHHFENAEAVLAGMNCEEAIFEVNKDQVSLIQKYFEIVKEIDSHRKNRVVLLAHRK